MGGGGDFDYSLLIRNTTVCWYQQLKAIWKGKILKLKMNKERDFLLLIITLRAFLSLFSQNKIKYSPIRIKRLLNRFLAMSSLHWCKAICTKSLFPLSHSHQTMSKSFCTKYSEVSTLFSKTLKSITLALKVHLFFFKIFTVTFSKYNNCNWRPIDWNMMFVDVIGFRWFVVYVYSFDI